MYARKVSDLVISHPRDDSTIEIIKWKEPGLYQIDRSNLKVTKVRDGRNEEVRRRVRFPIDDIL